MKVYVMTKAAPFEPEIYVGVKATRKLAEKELRTQYPHMKPSDDNSYVAVVDHNAVLLFIKEEELN